MLFLVLLQEIFQILINLNDLKDPNSNVNVNTPLWPVVDYRELAIDGSLQFTCRGQDSQNYADKTNIAVTAIAKLSSSSVQVQSHLN